MKTEQKVFFREVQQFSAWLRIFIAVAMLLSAIITCYALYSELSSDKEVVLSSVVLAIVLGMFIPLAIIALFLSIKLETVVYSDCLNVRFFPFHVSFRKFKKDDLAEYYSCTYRPILEYGGWGIRCGRKGKRAYNVSGNRGVQLVFKNGKRLLIGSQKPDEFACALKAIVLGT